MSQKLFRLLAFAAGVLGIAAETRLVIRERERLAAAHTRLARLEAQVQTARAQRDETLATQRAAAEQLAALQKSAAEQEARSAPAKAWWSRIGKLQQRLEEMPAEKIPELKLLGMKDWIEAVLYAETASDDQIRKVFAGLRTRARTRFASLLPEALRRFTDASGGELPANVLDLLPFLAPPADAGMLQHYLLKRTGKIGARNETLLAADAPDSGATVEIGLDSYKWNASTNDTANIGDTLKGLSSGLTDHNFDEFATEMVRYGAALETLQPAIETAFASFDEEFGVRLKTAVKQFTAANQGVPPANFAQLRSSLPELSRVAELARPVLAQFDYMLDHGGKPPDDSAKLRYYLEHPVDAERLLRLFKLTVDEDHVTMTFELK
ncbi:MAG: hypothetical protein ABIR80_01040 [Opitutaceae bacterium]